MDWTQLHRLADEARAAFAAAVRADTVVPPPPRPRSRHDARDWAIVLGRWRDGRTYRSLGAEHGLSANRIWQITYAVSRRWACVHLAGWEARWVAAGHAWLTRAREVERTEP
jgi:hypothetical protein